MCEVRVEALIVVLSFVGRGSDDSDERDVLAALRCILDAAGDDASFRSLGAASIRRVHAALGGR